ncbi:phosphotransferase [Candidatus Pacearchaeota archaeon]|nr:phosphotransferase [Candidatus Pacearchaeota archaeon]MBD3283552.1 phosphotransferase [Candidatus Pacearchaeota archaeon]
MEEKIKLIVEEALDCRVLKIHKISEGFSHFNFEADINKEPKKAIVRFSNNEKEEYDLAKEKFIIELLLKNDIPAPRILFFHDDCMILEKLKGIRLDTIWNSISKPERLDIVKKLGRLLKKIHKIKFKNFGKITKKGIISNKGFEFKKIGNKANYSPFLRECLSLFGEDFFRLLSYKHLSTEFVTKFIKVVYTNLDIIDYSGKPTLIHGDFHKSHIFVKKKNNKWEITGIIDFEFARSSSPEYDFIKLHRDNFFDDPEILKALIEGYGPINKKAVYIHRLMRDLGFAQVMRDSGNLKLSDRTIKDVEKRIKNPISQTSP